MVKKCRFRGNNEKGKIKTEENYINNGGKGLKNENFGFNRLPPTNSSWEKIYLKRGGGMIEMHNIYPCICLISKCAVLRLYFRISKSVCFKKQQDFCENYHENLFEFYLRVHSSTASQAFAVYIYASKPQSIVNKTMFSVCTYAKLLQF